MKPGIQFTDIQIGTGNEALPDKVVSVLLRLFLMDVAELTSDLHLSDRQLINLRRRDMIAGVRYGIEGMRVGGRRELIISPHLAFGQRGLPGKIPPNVSLRCIIELLDVRAQGESKPEDIPPGRQLIIEWRGDIVRSITRWSFYLKEDGHCTIIVTVPLPGLKWRHVRPKIKEKMLEPAQSTALIEEAATWPDRMPAACLSGNSIYMDHDAHDGGVPLENQNNELCIRFAIWEKGQVTSDYFIKENSKEWRTSGIFAIVQELVKPE